MSETDDIRKGLDIARDFGVQISDDTAQSIINAASLPVTPRVQSLTELMDERFGECTVWASTLQQMRLFARLLVSQRKNPLPPELLEVAAMSLCSQLELDMSFHPENMDAIKDYNDRLEKEEQS